MFGKSIVIVFATAAIALGGKLDRADLELPRSVKALRIAADDIRIDGVIDDEAWQRALFVSDFVQRDPIEGDAPTENTEFAVLYDDEYLYVSIQAHDTEPGGIRSTLSRRDEEAPSDWVHVSLDSYGDNRTAFEFWLNPQGVKRDIRRFDDTEQDVNWDAVWDGKTSVHHGGWSAEFRIPFRELRFSGQITQSWGLQVYRHISRKNEDIYWTYWPKEEAGHVRHYGRLTQLNSIPRQRRVYVAPYTTGKYAVSDQYVTAHGTKNYKLESTLGADIKVGVTNNLTLDVTVNPDFGQVEADPSELNLTDFETFYEEKRPFFVEGSNIFNYPLAFGGNAQNMFYPRRIGRQPQRRIYGVDNVEAPTATTILVASKLSGKTATGTSVGVMNAVTAEEVATIADQPKEHPPVEPLSNYFVSRIQQDLRAGNTTIGGIISSVNRKLDDPDLDFLRRDAYALGLDFSHRFSNETYLLYGMAAISDVSGSRTAITATQQSSTHYFQRPDDDDVLSVDYDATRMTGYAYKLALEKVRGEHIRGFLRTRITSPYFEANDIGYHGFVGQRQSNLWLQYREDDPGRIIRRWNVNLNGYYNQIHGDQPEIMGRGGNINASATFMNYWYLSGGAFMNLSGLHIFALWGGPALAMDPVYGVFWTIRSDNRKPLYVTLQGNRNGVPEDDILYVYLSPSLTWRPTRYFSLTASADLMDAHDTWMPWLGYGPVVDQQTDEERFIMATLDQTQLTTTLRFDLTLTPDLTIQFYGSPYLDAGKFSEDKLVVRARDADYDDRYHIFTDAEWEYDGNSNTYDIDGDGITNFEVPANRDFNYKEFHSNLVVRWEYKTGSVLYLVWSSNMNHFITNGDFSYGRDLWRLLRSKGENVFMLKASYLLNL
jgi:hypothetical protein